MADAPKSMFLLRRNRTGAMSLVLDENDLPLRFTYRTREYQVERTKSGKLIMTAVEHA